MDQFNHPGAHEPRQLDLVRVVAESESPPPVPYVLRDPGQDAGLLVTGDVTIISGEGKVGKSTLALSACLSMTCGVPLGRHFLPPNRPLRVLYLDAENNERLITRRWLQLVRGAGCDQQVRDWGDDPLLRYVWADLYNLDQQDSFDKVRYLVDQYRPDWIVLDSLIRFTRRSLKEESVINELYIERFRPLRDSIAGGVNVLAHLRKRSADGNNDPGQRLYGSVDLRNSSDSHVGMERAKGGGVTVAHEATRWDELYPPFSVRIEQSEDGSAVSLVCEVTEPGVDRMRRRLLDAGARGILRKELVDAVLADGDSRNQGSAQRMVSRQLAHLVQRGQAVFTPDGQTRRYRAVEGSGPAGGDGA